MLRAADDARDVASPLLNHFDRLRVTWRLDAASDRKLAVDNFGIDVSTRRWAIASVGVGVVSVLISVFAWLSPNRVAAPAMRTAPVEVEIASDAGARPMP